MPHTENQASKWRQSPCPTPPHPTWWWPEGAAEDRQSPHRRAGGTLSRGADVADPRSRHARASMTAVRAASHLSLLRSVLRLTVRRCATGQACTRDGSYHSADGRPLVNTLRFPDLRRMTARARALGVEPGW